MVKIFIDDVEYNVKSSENVLQACLSVGVDIPFFCWHPALGSVGACRQCAVTIYRDNNDLLGSLVMACMSEVKEGIRVLTLNANTKKFQKRIAELMMLNHPHDCPVCSEGGCCHLQDMTVLNQHYTRRYRFKKRIFNNQDLGPFISHNMNRCITCYRCTRYYTDYAGGKDFGVYGSSNKIYFGRLEDGRLENEFSGNLIDVCPTGVFTDRANIQNFSRKWDLQYAPSICHHCSIGCNISIGERLGNLCRVDNRYHSSINRYFLCDLGRFGSNHVNFSAVTQPFIRKNNKIKFLDYASTISFFIKKIKKSSNKILGVGSARASIESNMALYKLVGPKNFSNGMLTGLNDCMDRIVDVSKNSAIHTPSIAEIETYDAILIIGEDITQTSPLAALSVRQAVLQSDAVILKDQNIPIWHINAIKNFTQNKKNPLFIIYSDETKLDDISSWNYYGSIEQQLWLSSLILNHINEYDNYKHYRDHNNILLQIDFIVQKLCQAKKPLIISGASLSNVNIIQISYDIAQALQQRGLPVGLALFPPSANSMGLAMIPGISSSDMLNIIFSNKIDILIILENDLYRLYASHIIDKIFKKIKTIIVLDHQYHKVAEKADIFLPCTNFSESSGNIINYEARVQRFFKTHNPNFYNKKILKLEGWRWIYAVYKKNPDFSFIQSFSIDQMMQLCSLWNPIFKNISSASPPTSFKIFGQKIARSPICVSGRAAVFSNKNVHEPQTPRDIDSMFAFSMEGSQQTNNNFSHFPFLWSPKWNSNQSLYKSALRFQHKSTMRYEGVLLFKNYKKKILKNCFIKNSFKDNTSSSLVFKVIPYYQLLGSEEMSHNYFINIMKIKNSYATLNYLDADKIQIHEGDMLQFQINNVFFKFPVRLSKKISLLHIGVLFGCDNFPISFFHKTAHDLIKIQ